MSNFKLNLPTDIPWERVCVTEDMVDDAVCDRRFPPKWHSSLAVFKYVPEEEFQSYPSYKITYLKVTATITGYQPQGHEVGGDIDWDGLDVGLIGPLEDALTSYHPCNGAILQVSVGPRKGSSQIPKEKYPFFLDFEPKKREMYEVATETNEKQSRSVQSLNITKGAAQGQSLEVFDIDMGGSYSFGGSAQASAAGTGGGASWNISESSHGQWGTKKVNTEESMQSRTSDVGQEKRESYSFTTQISQMYNLLDSYHIGTNRAVFFIQPRPHTLQEPSGFVKGPRPVEGIQEFFLVVAQLKEQGDFCVSLKLDTAHLVEEDILDYAYRFDLSELVEVRPKMVTAPGGPRAFPTSLYRDGEVYECYLSREELSRPYKAPDGWFIHHYVDGVKDDFLGGSSVTEIDSKNLKIEVSAANKACFSEDGDRYVPTYVEDGHIIFNTGAYAKRQVLVFIQSEIPSRKIGTQEVILMTTRGLCCCPEQGIILQRTPVYTVDFRSIPDYFGTKLIYPEKTIIQEAGLTFESVEKGKRDLDSELSQPFTVAGVKRMNIETSTIQKDNYSYKDNIPIAESHLDRRMPIRKANELTGFIKEELIKSMASPRSENVPKPFIETDFFISKIKAYLSSSWKGKKVLNTKVGEDLPKSVCKALEGKCNKSMGEITTFDLLVINNYELGKLAKMEPSEIARLKLTKLGVKFKDDKRPSRKKGE